MKEIFPQVFPSTFVYWNSCRCGQQDEFLQVRLICQHYAGQVPSIWLFFNLRHVIDSRTLTNSDA